MTPAFTDITALNWLVVFGALALGFFLRHILCDADTEGKSD